MRFLQLFIILLFSINLNAQKASIDSLQSELNDVKEDSLRILLFIQIADSYFDTAPDSSVIYYRKAVDFSEASLTRSKNEDKEKINYLYLLSLYELGYGLSFQMKYTESEEYLNKALEFTNYSLKQSDNESIIIKSQKLKSDILSAIGDIYLDKGYYTIALNNYINATEIIDELIYEDIIERSHSAQKYFSLGLVHYYLKNYDKALDYYQKSKIIAQEYQNKTGVAKCNNNIAIIKSQKGLYDEALIFLDSTLAYAEENNNLLLQAQVFDNMADCFIAKEDYKKAELYLAKSLILTKKLKNIQGEIFVMLGLADLYTKKGRFQKALEYAKNAAEKSKAIRSISLEKSAYLQLSEIYELSGSFKNALFYHKRFKLLEDSLFNKEKNRQTEEMEAKYQAAKKQKEIDLQKTELERQETQIRQKRNLNYAYTAVIVLLMLIIIYIWFSYKRKQKRNNVIRTQNKKITDSIEYAKKIQTAALPSEKYLNEIFKSHFVIYKPLQIVSGDFYWAVHKDQYLVLAAADCTGHGVPGAFVSMLGISLLNELSLNSDLTRPDLILEEMRFILKRSFGQKGEDTEQTDGIDISLCVIDNHENILYFSAANNPAYLLRGKEITEMEPVMNPIGIYPKEIPFKLHTFNLEANDILYLFTDGYADQFGGKKNKTEKITIAAFKKIILKNAHKPLNEQKKLLENHFNDWQNGYAQIDDVLVFAVKY